MTAGSRRFALLALVGVLAGGCLGRSPSPEFYTLRAVEARSGPAHGDGVAVGLGPLRLPSYLDQASIARRTGESEIRYEKFHRWAGPLDAELVRVMGANLGALLQTDRVVLYPSGAPFALSYQVTVDFDRFEAGPDDAVTLSARWAILPGDGGEALASGRTELVQPARSGKASDLAAAHSAAAGALSRAITERLRALPVASAPSP